MHIGNKNRLLRWISYLQTKLFNINKETPFIISIKSNSILHFGWDNYLFLQVLRINPLCERALKQ